MLIGMTYDLRQEYLDMGYSQEETAEFDRPDTVDAIERALLELGHKVDRIGHIRQLTARLAAGGRWDLVFNISEGMNGIAREAQIPALLEAYGIPFTFSGPMTLALTMHKAMAKRVLRDLGLPTPAFVQVDTPADIGLVDLPFPVFAKPLAEGTSKGIDASSVIYDLFELREVCSRLLERFRQPVLVESFLPGREFTVGILGTGADARVVGTTEIILRSGAERDVYSYVNKEQCEELVSYMPARDRLADEAERTALAAWRGLECRDAGRVDLRTDRNGVPSIIEINPLAGLHPAHSDLPIICGQNGIPYLSLIADIVASALQRTGPREPWVAV